MQQDISISKSNPQYFIDAHNIRITAREGRTLLSVTNEKGPRELELKSPTGGTVTITGTILGHCVLNNYLILFVHSGQYGDKILRIDMSKDNPEVVSLFNPESQNTSLGFNVDYPIEALPDYESDLIQKIYWTDGLNQPRMVNIMNPPATWEGAFDFVPEIGLNESVTVEKLDSGIGVFPPGIVQYSFTYYNKYGQETNIFHTTPLHYSSYFDRGGSPEDRVSNSFKITITGYDKHFDYIRVYSVIRTSINDTPVVKRVEDISIKSSTGPVTYIDTNTTGETIDPSKLLYIGGEEIIAETMCAKDGTMFLGGLKIKRRAIDKGIKGAISGSASNAASKTKEVELAFTSKNSFYPYASGLNAQSAGFKSNEYYRLGIQFQHKTGKWSEPCFIGNFKVTTKPECVVDNADGVYKLVKPTIEYIIPSEYTCNGEAKSLYEGLKEAGYRRMRALIAMPSQHDRTILAQGVINSTVSTTKNRQDGDLYAQSSWFFRANGNIVDTIEDDDRGRGRPGTVTTMGKNVTAPTYRGRIPYMTQGLKGFTTGTSLNRADPLDILPIEIQGHFDEEHKFYIEQGLMTFHSPEIELDDGLVYLDLHNTKGRLLGWAECLNTASDISVQTSAPTLGSNANGFIPQSSVSKWNNGIVSGWQYEDFIVTDNDEGGFEKYQSRPVRWVVYPWQQSGSFNNDVNRPNDKGVRSSVLQKKVISNLRFFDTVWSDSVLSEDIISTNINDVPQVFYSDHVSIVKVGDKIYEGNIDTLLSPSEADGSCCFGWPYGNDKRSILGDYGSPMPLLRGDRIFKTHLIDKEDVQVHGLFALQIQGDSAIWVQVSNTGKKIPDLASKKEGIRMKYKSTPHIVFATNNVPEIDRSIPSLHIMELYRDYDEHTLYGGLSQDALKSNLWIPAGPAVPIEEGRISFEYGDTWYSRYDCLKTYPYTTEDPNQIVEIGSFMVESHLNLDGRYDRNRGQINNLNMSPQNFNLMNPVYSQLDNFFNYRILDDDFYDLDVIPNQITWSLQKSPAMEVDEWTHVTLASTLNLDGTKGEVRSLNVRDNNIYCFQDRGVSTILFNSRVQIPTSDGIPIEISNSYKVDGNQYISNGLGCKNKYSICSTPSALYFLDSISNHLYSIGEKGVQDLSGNNSVTVWFQSINPSKWTGRDFSTRLFYDSMYKDLYIVTEEECLCFSELMEGFTSYMSYSDIPVMFNISNRFFCIKDNYLNEMFAGDYGYFFDEYKPYDFTFVVNGITENATSLDKIFTNIEFRADRWSDEIDGVLSQESPFDYIRVWNEYQDTGEVLLKNLKNRPSNLKRKFRVWRIDIPRNAYSRRDRIRNTWCKIKIGSSPKYRNGNDGVVELHDLSVVYYI